MSPRRRLVACGTALVLLAGCSSTLSGHGAVGTALHRPTGGPSSPAAPSSGDFPSSPGGSGGSSGSGGSGAPAAGGRVASPDGDFSVVPPSGWREDRAAIANSQAIDAYVGPQLDGFQVNINVVRTPAPGANLLQYVSSAIDLLRGSGRITTITQPKATTLGGAAAYDYAFSDAQSGVALQQTQTVALHGGNVYAVTFTARAGSQFSAEQPAAVALTASWQWS